jgi:hypothetical protein
LLQFVEDGIVVAGLPVLVSDQVDAAAVFWGIPKAHVVIEMQFIATVGATRSDWMGDLLGRLGGDLAPSPR